MLNKKSN